MDNRFAEVIDLAEDFCGLQELCYEKDGCLSCPEKLAFLRVSQADRIMREMETNGRVYRP